MGAEKRLIGMGIGLGDAVQNRSTRSRAQTGDSVHYHSLLGLAKRREVLGSLARSGDKHQSEFLNTAASIARNPLLAPSKASFRHRGFTSTKVQCSTIHCEIYGFDGRHNARLASNHGTARQGRHGRGLACARYEAG